MKTRLLCHMLLLCSAMIGPIVGQLGGCSQDAGGQAQTTPSANSSSASSSDSTNGKTDAMPAKPRYSKSGYDITPLPREKVKELASKLSPAAYKITQEADTENGDYTDVALGARSGFTVVNAANNTQIIAFPRSKRWIRLSRYSRITRSGFS